MIAILYYTDIIAIKVITFKPIHTAIASALVYRLVSLSAKPPFVWPLHIASRHQGRKFLMTPYDTQILETLLDLYNICRRYNTVLTTFKEIFLFLEKDI